MARVNDEAGTGDHTAILVRSRDVDQTWGAQPIKILRPKCGHQLKKISLGFPFCQQVQVLVLEPCDGRATVPCVPYMDQKSSGHHPFYDLRYAEGIRCLGKGPLHFQIFEKVYHG